MVETEGKSPKSGTAIRNLASNSDGPSQSSEVTLKNKEEMIRTSEEGGSRELGLEEN